MSSSATKEKFMIQGTARPEALPWLENIAPQENLPTWIKALRATGAEAFAQTGLPAPKQEGWQYLNLRGLTPERFSHDADAHVPKDLAAPIVPESFRIVLLNGRLQPSSSALPEGVEIVPLTDASKEDVENLTGIGDMQDAPFKALNAAWCGAGFVLRVAAGREVETPIEVMFWTTEGVAAYPRVLYRIGENAAVKIIERHMGAGDHFSNLYAVCALAPAARLNFYRVLAEAEQACHVSHTVVQQEKDSSFEGFSGVFAGGLGRQQFHMLLIDSGISSMIGGAYLLKDSQVHDFTVLAEHFEPDGMSAQHFKGVIDDKARAIFQGKIQVRRPAQKTDGYQSHHALLLSDLAEADVKPELEIYADDVKCSHGATAGALDPEALFYLQSRGIPKDAARGLLIRSFLETAIDRVSFAPMRGFYTAQAEAWLEARV